MSRITQRTLPHPDTSWRRNRSPDTVISNQNHKMNMNTAKTSATKLVNVKPPSNSMTALPIISVALISAHYHCRLLKNSAVARGLDSACMGMGESSRSLTGSLSTPKKIEQNLTPASIWRLFPARADDNSKLYVIFQYLRVILDRFDLVRRRH